MYVRIHSPKEAAGSNMGSSGGLATYLDKENDNKNLVEQEHFFNNSSDKINRLEVISKIDKNTGQLTKKEAKFFMISINPSHKELQHIAQMATGRTIENISEMTPAEINKYNQIFKEYVNDTMDLYAKGFNKGLDKDSILYFAKVEQERTFKGYEKQVKEGLYKSGDLKPGLQTHCHVIVSRKDITNKIKISPMANSRGNKNTLNGEKVQNGFNRDNFKKEAEALFDIKLEYDRSAPEYYVNNKADNKISQVVESQYKSYIQNMSQFKGIRQTDLGQNEAKQMAQILKSVNSGDINSMGESAKQFVQSAVKGNLNEGELGKLNAARFIELAQSIASGNPVAIARTMVKTVSEGISM